MTTSWLDASFDFKRHTNIIVVVDVVESVRLMEQNEHDFIQRWHHFVAQTRKLLPEHRGRMHKSLGDGLMLEFADAQGFAQAAFAMHRLVGRANEELVAEEQIHLRIGAHLAEFVADEHDIYGTDVNLTARIATLAGPGEIVISGPLRDRVTDGLDADVEDLGECHLKHVSEPVHVYRVGPAGHSPVVGMPLPAGESALRPTIAVVPFSPRTSGPGDAVLGEVLAEEIIAGLSRCAQINVISRLSTTALRDRVSDLPRLRHVIAAPSTPSFALTGAYRITGDRVKVTVELADLRSGHVVWADSLKSSVSAILAGEDELTALVVNESSEAVARVETDRAATRPLPTLQSASLQMGAITLMHRAGRGQFERVREMLEHLIDRHPRVAAPRAWLAKWHVLRITRGMAGADHHTENLALDLTHRALDIDPQCSLAMAVEGFVRCHLSKDLDAAAWCYDRALESNPNESLAWLFKGVLHAFQDAGAEALDSSERALRLSPLDPMLYFYESLAATAALTAGRNDRAVELARHSLRANCSHPSTLRVLTIAQTLQGETEDAKRSAQLLLSLEPAFTVSGFLARSPGGRSASAQRFADALLTAGIPK